MLRQLFLDGKSSLLHIVNRKYQLKIEFRTTDFTRRPLCIPDVYLMDLDPSHFYTSKILSISLDSFMMAPCIILNETTISVRDIIKLCANSKGGVHFGNPKSGAEKNAHDMDQLLFLCGQEPSIKLLREICRVSLMGLKQLVDDITRISK